MDSHLFNACLEEAVKLKRTDILDHDFAKQTAFIRHPHRHKALFCTRRAAKSYTGGLYLAETAERYAGSNSLYLGLTRASAKGIIWKDILKQIDRKHDLGLSFNGSELTATAQNGSMIYVSGIDADEDEMHKLLGKKYKLVVLDEAQAYSVDLRTLIYGILGPAMIDEGGTICVMGTAGNLTQGLFFDVTNGKEPGWELFEWSAHDNPYVATQWQEELDRIDRERPLFKQTALYQQWFLNKWVIDEDAKVYRYDSVRNDVLCLPGGLDGWHHVLGLDLAHSPDSSSFTVGCYHDYSPTLYFRYSKKFPEMDLTDVAAKVKELDRDFNFEIQLVDGAAKQSVAELNNRHGLKLINADKREKADFIKLMNDDFIQQKIKLLPETQDLKAEYGSLIWETDINGKVLEPRKEHPGIHNDCCDGALYLWRYAYSYLFEKPAPFVDPNIQAEWEKRHKEALAEQIRKEQNPDHLELDWDAGWDNQDDAMM